MARFKYSGRNKSKYLNWVRMQKLLKKDPRHEYRGSKGLIEFELFRSQQEQALTTGLNIGNVS